MQAMIKDKERIKQAWCDVDLFYTSNNFDLDKNKFKTLTDDVLDYILPHLNDFVFLLNVTVGSTQLFRHLEKISSRWLYMDIYMDHNV